ncbi:MAG TPA: hypothetical protein VHC22_34115 [Pirellulales bacterium]|nr:hypothetical protein [Pirellulales bacterium]
MMPHPTSFVELIRRLAPDVPEDTCGCPPLVASAIEMQAATGKRQRPFWVIVHSLTDHGLRLLHARPLHSTGLCLRIQTKDGAVVQAMLVAKESHPNGPLFETSAEFHRVGLDVGQLA